ncbi:MAG: hypothetical protein AB1422_13855 [bacterium]
MDETLNIPDFHQGNFLSTTTLKLINKSVFSIPLRLCGELLSEWLR